MTNETVHRYFTGGNVSCTATSSNTSIGAAIVIVGSPNQYAACQPNYMAHTNEMA